MAPAQSIPSHLRNDEKVAGYSGAHRTSPNETTGSGEKMHLAINNTNNLLFPHNIFPI